MEGWCLQLLALPLLQDLLLKYVCVCACVCGGAEVLSKPFMGSSEVQLGAVSSLARFPPDGDGRALALSRCGLCSPLPVCWAAGIFSIPAALLWSLPHTSAMVVGLKISK